METALSTLRLMPFSKNQVELFSNQIKDSLTSGDVDPLELAIYFKAMEETIKQVKETMSSLALSEAQKYGKSFEFKGAKIEVKELGTSYDYSNCGDIYLNKFSEQISELTEKRKTRETIVKALKEPMTAVDEETGETFTMYPPIKKSTTGIAISLIKV